MSVLKRKWEIVAEERDELLVLFEALRQGSEEEALAILQRIRTSTDLASLLESIKENGDLPRKPST